jgi:hypothetical protein
MDFRALPPQWLQGIGRGPAGPHTRFGKRSGSRFTISCRSAAIPGASLPVGFVSPPRSSGSLRRQLGSIRVVAGEHGPDDPRVLVRQRYSHDVRMPPFAHPAEPKASLVLLAMRLAEHGPCAVDHERAQVAVAALADAEQPGAAASRSLPRHEPQPCRELPAVAEACPVAHRGHQRRRRDRPDAFDPADTLADLVRPEEIAPPPV